VVSHYDLGGLRQQTPLRPGSRRAAYGDWNNRRAGFGGQPRRPHPKLTHWPAIRPLPFREDAERFALLEHAAGFAIGRFPLSPGYIDRESAQRTYESA
jgi:hypothetical protein